MVKLDLIPPAPAHITRVHYLQCQVDWRSNNNVTMYNGAFHHRSTLGYINPPHLNNRIHSEENGILGRGKYQSTGIGYSDKQTRKEDAHLCTSKR